MSLYEVGFHFREGGIQIHIMKLNFTKIDLQTISSPEMDLHVSSLAIKAVFSY